MCPTSQRLRFRLLRTWGFAWKKLCLATFHPSLPLFSLPLSNFFFVPPSTKIVLSERVKVRTSPYSHTLRAIKSDRPGPVPAVLVLDVLTLRHEELCDFLWKSNYFDTFARNFFVLPGCFSISKNDQIISNGEVRDVRGGDASAWN